MFVLSEKPRSIGGIIKDGFRLYKPVFLKIWPIMIAMMVLFVPGMLNDLFFKGKVDPSTLPYPFFILGFIIVLILYWFILAMLQLTNQVILHQAGEYKYALKVSFQRLFRCLVVAFLVFLGPVIMMFLANILHSFVRGPVSGTGMATQTLGAFSVILSLVISVVYLISLFLFCYFVIPVRFSVLSALFESQGVFLSIKKGFGLVWGKWWRTVAVLLLRDIIGFLMILPIIVIDGVLFVFFLSPDMFLTYIVSAFSIVAIFFIPMPFSMAVIVRQYHDLEVRYRLKRGE